MHKFYVTTGDSEIVLMATSPKDAAIKVLKRMFNLRDYGFGVITQVRERGFDHNCDTSLFFQTKALLEEAFV